MPIELHQTPSILSTDELAALLRLSKTSARDFMWRELVRLGGVVKIGNRLFVHTWAVNKWLDGNKIKADNPRAVRTKEKHLLAKEKSKQKYRELRALKPPSGRPFGVPPPPKKKVENAPTVE